MSGTTARPQSLLDFLRFCKEASISTLKDYTHIESLHETVLSSDSIILGHWMPVIIISSAVMQITFKTHLMTTDGNTFSASSFKKSPDDMSSQQILDFFKEYCNMVGGKIKWLLEFNQIASGISLPILLRGFDEVFFSHQETPYLFSDKWKITSDTASLICSILIELQDKALWKQLKLNYEVSSDQGEVTFL